MEKKKSKSAKTRLAKQDQENDIRKTTSHGKRGFTKKEKPS